MVISMAQMTRQEAAAKARAAKALRYQERLADKLRQAGWEVKPPQVKITTGSK